MAESLKSRAKHIDSRALVASRLKRMPTIAVKLNRFECRAVLRSVKRVEALTKLYEGHPYRAAELVKKFDYIQEPKEDGYRGIHLVYKYQGEHQAGAFKGMRIEIQLRSRLQHSWATAVETIDIFTGQALKSNIGNAQWKRFFVLMGSAIALMEKRPLIPGYPETFDKLTTELKALCKCLNIPDVFYGLIAGMQMSKRLTPKAKLYILTLDSKERTTRATGFKTPKEADERYLELEKEN